MTALLRATDPARARDESGASRAKRYVAFALALGAVALAVTIAMLARPTGVAPAVHEVGPASSCAGRSWPTTEISCNAAQNMSVTALVPVSGPWTARIWLTTLGAVDARLHPRRQVSDHPASDAAAVWLFIYEDPAGDRVLHVAAAANAQPGAFVYIYLWSELGFPDMPTTMPSPP